MKSVVKFFLYMGLISLIIYTSGCLNRSGESEKTSNEAPETITLERSAEPLVVGDTLPTVGDFVDWTTVVLYFANEDGQLVAEQRDIPKVVGIARETIRELILGPENGMLDPTIPAGTTLLDIDVNEDGLCTVDFSKELIIGHSGGSGSEYLTVYSIVNTLTQFGTIQEVQLRVDGKIVETIAGHVGVDAPLVRDDQIISAMGLPEGK